MDQHGYRSAIATCCISQCFILAATSRTPVQHLPAVFAALLPGHDSPFASVPRKTQTDNCSCFPFFSLFKAGNCGNFQSCFSKTKTKVRQKLSMREDVTWTLTLTETFNEWTKPMLKSSVSMMNGALLVPAYGAFGLPPAILVRCDQGREKGPFCRLSDLLGKTMQNLSRV